jgi:hypothetical protein
VEAITGVATVLVPAGFGAGGFVCDHVGVTAPKATHKITAQSRILMTLFLLNVRRSIHARGHGWSDWNLDEKPFCPAAFAGLKSQKCRVELTVPW